MKNVILRYPSDKSYKEHKFKVTDTNLCSVLRTRIAAELTQFKDVNYLLISKKYDNCMSFLKEDKPFNKLFNENRINIELVIPPKEAEILLPNQTIIHFPINLTNPVFENVKELFSFLIKTENTYSIMKNSEDFIYESFTFFFSPNHSDNDGFDDFSNDSNNENVLNSPRIASSTLPLLFQGWSGEKLTLIRRLSINDLIIAEERWKKREKQIQNMKKTFEDKENTNDQNKKTTVKFETIIEQNEKNIPIKEKSRSISAFDLKNAKNELQADEAQNQSQEKNDQSQENLPSNDNFFDFTTEDFFYNCQLSVLNKICVFDLDVWASLACLQCLASHANLKHTQIQNLIPFIPDYIQNASVQNDKNQSLNLTDILTEMKHKYNKYERMQAMRAYIQLCVDKGESFCYSEEVKFLLLTKKWRVSARRIIYISPNNISIAKDANSLNFLYQSKISDIINVAFDGDFITITFEIHEKNDEQDKGANMNANNNSLSVKTEKWRIKSSHPQILIYTINEFKSIFTQSSHILHNLYGPTSASLKKYKSTDFKNLVSAHHRAKSSGLIGNLLLRPNLPKKLPSNKGNADYSNNKESDDSNNDNEINIVDDINDSNLSVIYYDNYESSIEVDSDFVEPGVSKLICTSKENANKSCFDILANERSRDLKLVKKLHLPYKIEKNNFDLLNSYSGVDDIEEIPDLNWLLNVDNLFSLSQKNGKIIIIFGVLLIIVFIFVLLK